MTTGGQLALRTPAWVRALGGVFALSWVYPLAADPPAGGFLVLAGIVGTVVLFLVVRASVCQVVATVDDRLTIRNVWGTRTVRRDEIDAVGIDRADGWFREGWAVWLVLADGSRHRLDVTAVPFLGPSLARLERQADAVRGWVDGRPQAYV